MKVAEINNKAQGSMAASLIDPSSHMLFVNNAQQLGDMLFNFNVDIKEDYEEVFHVPNDYRDTKVGKTMNDCTNKVFGAVYKYTKTVMYYILVVIFGLFLSFIWALFLAINQFFITWIIKPVFKIFFTWLNMAYLMWRPFTRIALDPFFQSVGQMFSGLLGNIHLTLHGMGRKKKDELVDSVMI